MTGTVTQMEWINPHAWIHISVKKPDGKVEAWMVEAGAPNALLRRGFNKQSLPPGTVITVEGYRPRTARIAPTAATSPTRTAASCLSARQVSARRTNGRRSSGTSW